MKQDSKEILPELFPNLKTTKWDETSEIDERYNCIAFAYGRTDRFYWPFTQHSWPAGVPMEETVEAFRELYKTIGYEDCADGRIEEGFDKVAIFADKKATPTHAAVFRDGKWRSKLGRLWDISHELEGLNSDDYGDPVAFLRRPIQ